MTIQVDQTLCTGCGTCLDSCPTGAIQLADGHAVIDKQACTLCEACLDTCPNDAILVAAPVPAEPTPVLALASQSRPGKPDNVSLAGAALLFLESQVAPRLADVLLTALERKLAQPTPARASPAGRQTGGQGERRQTRRRGRRAGYQKQDERR